MDREWNDNQPIYRQLRDRVVAMILDGVLKGVNPLTVLKGYQQLVDEQLIESRRGLGMFVNVGARSLLLKGERQKFLAEEWPRVQATIQRLGLTAQDLLNGDASGQSSGHKSSSSKSSSSESSPGKSPNAAEEGPKS